MTASTMVPSVEVVREHEGSDMMAVEGGGPAGAEAGELAPLEARVDGELSPGSRIVHCPPWEKPAPA